MSFGKVMTTCVFIDETKVPRDSLVCLLTCYLLSLFSAIQFLAALIRGNRNNCTQFSQNLDWLVCKLERLESSSGGTENLPLLSLANRIGYI